MRQLATPFSFRSLLLSFVLLCCGACAPSAQTRPATAATDQAARPTTIYVVRHAEKITDNPQDQNPGLSEAGTRRAQALQTYLAQVPVQALYATQYQRTQQTLVPIASTRSLEIMEYDAAKTPELAQKILQQHPGQTVVVSGHSNTVLPLVEALGAKRPLAEVKDSQYDYLFKVTVRSDAKAQVDVLRYGESTP